MELKFYYCEDCDNTVIMLKNSGVPVVCCGQKMIELIPGTADASTEKHVPVFEVSDSQVHVTVGAAEHPMEDEHFIEWIAIQTEKGIQYAALQPGDKPAVSFAISADDKVEAAYAYCNLHSLWKA